MRGPVMRIGWPVGVLWRVGGLRRIGRWLRRLWLLRWGLICGLRVLLLTGLLRWLCVGLLLREGPCAKAECQG